MNDLLVASVILENNLSTALDYSIPEDLQPLIKNGSIVEIPLRGHFRKGIVFEIKKSSQCKELFPIKKILSEKVITQDLFNLALWMSRYYATSLSKIFKFMIPSSLKKEHHLKYQLLISTSLSKKQILKEALLIQREHPEQFLVLQTFLKLEKKESLLADLLKNNYFSQSPINSLVKKKILQVKKIPVAKHSFIENLDFFPSHKKTLNQDQKSALSQINNGLDKNSFETFLLYGVTSSGKTEVYLQAIEYALSLNKTCIMLVPEIALTSQTIERFKARFQQKIAILHHRRSGKEKYDDWQGILKGEVKIVIGARSAVFAPLSNLGLIIVDEEHDASYKQNEEEPSYNAKNIALMRGKFLNAAVILGSATPSIESYHHALEKKYHLLTLKERAGSANLAKIIIADMKKEQEKKEFFSYFSDLLLSKIKERFENGEQTILFLNRRGYHTTLICQNCYSVYKCQHCDVALTYHKKENYLICHLCSNVIKKISPCKECRSENSFKYQGYGTEHIESTLYAIFPNIKILRADKDTTMQKDGHETIFKQFRSGKADVLIGTQMVVKGLHFPQVTLVGILNSDGPLNIPDFRSSEQVFQIITQVAGRAGRSALPGEVIIQTYIPENDTIKLAAKQDYSAFYESEIVFRKMFGYPPFAHFVKIVFSGKKIEELEHFANEFRAAAIGNLSCGYTIHPIVACGKSKIKELFRLMLLIRGKNVLPIAGAIQKVKSSVKKPSSINIFIDVDPISCYF